jgi:hypothetical protein
LKPNAGQEAGEAAKQKKIRAGRHGCGSREDAWTKFAGVAAEPGGTHSRDDRRAGDGAQGDERPSRERTRRGSSSRARKTRGARGMGRGELGWARASRGEKRASDMGSKGRAAGELHGRVTTGDDGTRAGELNKVEPRQGSSTASREGKRGAAGRRENARQPWRAEERRAGGAREGRAMGSSAGREHAIQGVAARERSRACGGGAGIKTRESKKPARAWERISTAREKKVLGDACRFFSSA